MSTRRVLAYIDCAAIGAAVFGTVAYLGENLSTAFFVSMFITWAFGTQVTRLR